MKARSSYLGPFSALLLTILCQCSSSAAAMVASPPPPPSPLPAPTLAAVSIDPKQAFLTPGASRGFSVRTTWSDGTHAAAPVSYSAEGGTISTDGIYLAGSAPGAFVVIASALNGQLVDTALVRIEEPPSPLPALSFPAGYDPARLGGELVVGESWQDLQMGDDQGYASLLGKHCWRQGQSPYPAPVRGQIMVESDPIFGKVVRFDQPNYHAHKFSGTVECIKTFSPVANFWYRAVVRLDGNGNMGGFTSRGTGARGGSTTWKMMFAFPEGAKNRMEFELYADGGLLPLFGQPGNNVTVATQLPQGNAPVAPIQSTKTAKLSIVNPGQGLTGNLLQNKEWFELVMNFRVEGPNQYSQRYFVRQLTTGSGTLWAPQPYPRWRGWLLTMTSGVIQKYYKIHLGGNKSQTNDGPFDQIVRWGPWEVTTALDPYGWDKYGR